MRIKTIRLSWFRGAADPVALEPNCKSLVVYGVNGSGKSSFVDGVEYVLNDERIGHLAHEYSGKHQEKAVPNTHRPKDRNTELIITFKDDSQLKIEMKQDGSSTSAGAEAVAMDTWDYRRTVLRQDEVAAFIHDTKGGKYSALLPLLGLHEMEIAAENLRQLARGVEHESKLRETKAVLKELETKRKSTFGADGDGQILKRIEDLHAKYCPDNVATKDPLSRCSELEEALAERVTGLSAEQKRHLILQDMAALDLKGNVDAVRRAGVTLGHAVEPFITEKLEVLRASGAFIGKMAGEVEVDCPACGRVIAGEVFQAHITTERERLQETIQTFDSWKAALGTLCDTVKSLKVSLEKAPVASWRDELAKGALGENLAHLGTLNTEALRTSCGEADLNAIEAELWPLINAAGLSSKDAPPDVQQLSIDKQAVEIGRALIEAKDQAAGVTRAEALISFVNSLEEGTREELRLRSHTVIADISADIQAMWAVLHPGEAIEDVRLYLPKDTNKAIDIGLKFHGIEQDSPRLTLSEGFRNSLGLCIFLAMAKREADKDRPVFLDDVVVSLDRNHRGMIAELLEKQFGGRQVIVLTHDREWYTELRQQLDNKTWAFRTLLPYESPAVGIRWSHKTTTFGDARAQLKDRPDAAGNDARKIMDVELALIAERLKIGLPYLRGDRNDGRMAHEFLERFVGDGKKCFQKKADDKEYVPYTEATEAFAKADTLVISWANRASHSFDVVRPEAAKLIDTCEKALEFFTCPSCGKSVWFANAEKAEWVQCQCGQIRWRYGKA